MVEWRPVVGWEGLYDVSSEGRVRRGSGTERCGTPTKSGHVLISLSQHGRTYQTYMHRLVAEAFIPNPEGHPLVRHWDDDPSNNTVENLRWGTDADNKADAVRNGRNFYARKTECVNKHPYTAENTYTRPNGHRDCRLCILERSRRAKRKKREAGH